jgi:hypothetical protein
MFHSFKLLSIRLALLGGALLPATLVTANTFDFRNTTSGAGVDLDNLSTGSSTVGGLTLTMTLFPGGLFNQTGSAFGINAPGGSDASDELDSGEGFTFSFSQDVTITSISVSSFGSGNSGTLSFNGGSSIGSVTSTGLTVINSSVISSGTTLRFESSSGAFSLDSIAVSAIPEPSAYAFLAGMGGLVLAASRRRRTHPATSAT